MTYKELITDISGSGRASLLLESLLHVLSRVQPELQPCLSCLSCQYALDLVMSAAADLAIPFCRDLQHNLEASEVLRMLCTISTQIFCSSSLPKGGRIVLGEDCHVWHSYKRKYR